MGSDGTGYRGKHGPTKVGENAAFLKTSDAVRLSCLIADASIMTGKRHWRS